MKTTYFLLTLFIILTSYGIQASVQYEYYLCVFKDCRKQISTTYTGTSTSTSRKVLKFTYDNSKSKVVFENTYTFSETNSRSMSVGAEVSAKTLGIEIGASIGGSASYSRTESYSYHVKIPPGKIGRVYASEITEVAKYRHVIQHQDKGLGEPDSKYKNVPGGMSTSYSTVTTKSHKFSLETN